MFFGKCFYLFLRKRCSDSPAGPDTSIPAFSCEGYLQIVDFIAFHRKIFSIGFRHSNVMSGFSLSGPGRIILKHQFFTGSGNGILLRQPGHIQNGKTSGRLQYPGKHRGKLFMLKIEIALACRYHIKTSIREIQLFRRPAEETDIHTGLL